MIEDDLHTLGHTLRSLAKILTQSGDDARSTRTPPFPIDAAHEESF